MQVRSYLTLLGFLIICYAQAQLAGSVPDAFAKIPESAYRLHYKSDKTGLVGGHLQGIQMYNSKYEDKEYNVIMTASSSTKAYYIKAVIPGNNAPLRLLNTAHISTEALSSSTGMYIIDSMPYRHAGGFQLSGDVLAVGVEDNMAKNKSKVVLVNVKDNNSITVINRRGTFERSTAGAVGYIRLNTDQYLIAVGDWDSKHIDFYLSQRNNVAALDSITTYTADTIKPWGSYQNINLISDTSGKLYMIGFCLDAKGNRADLFEVNLNDKSVALKAISTRYFKSSKGAGFRYAAGINIDNDYGMLQIIACARTLKKGKNYINAWL